MLRSCLIGVFALTGIGFSAETSTPTSTEAPVGDGESRLVSDLISPHLKVALSTSLPAYRSVRPVLLEGAEGTLPTKINTDDGDVLVLPSLMVRGPRSLKPADVLTLAGKLDHYLGPKKEFDRRLLNRVVLRWDFGPVSVSLFGAIKNESRAKELYSDDQRLRNRAALLDLASRLKRTGDAALSDRLRRESDDLFFRKPAFGRK